MICEKCGEEIPDGYLYCEKCGNAVQIVPDFDLDLEESLLEMQSDVAGSIDALFTPDGERKLTQDTITMPAVKGKIALLHQAIFVTAVLIVLVAAVLFDSFSKEKNASDYTKLAEEAYSLGNYEEAAEYYESAISMWDGEFLENLNEMRNHYAEALALSGDLKKAKDIYATVIREDPADEVAYQGLIDILLDEENVQAINALVDGAEDKIKDKFYGYMSLSPSFSEEPGEFEDVFDLSIEPPKGIDGDIYYSLENSLDGEIGTHGEDELYSEPIRILEGDNAVKAVFENKYGLRSEYVTGDYLVKFEVPKAPVFHPKSGTYKEPAYISVEVPEGYECFYTEDGTDPDENSESYRGKLAMPIGKSKMKFVLKSDKGVLGEIAEANFDLRLMVFYTPEDAVNYTASALVMSGELIDIYGNAPGQDGKFKYMCTKAVMEGSRIYYIVDEFLEDKKGNLEVTGKIFAVDSMGGMLYRSKRDDEGNYQFNLF
ncbi:MAG: chitobiase/beta-hexosaminidase C-terminal domain-containing protein [Lachnospiraceae bacterium]|nr:chitobiase/beta-hexosaminidase C-terminal domain-containing protein [Lachnospiraceae bacterium]